MLVLSVLVVNMLFVIFKVQCCVLADIHMILRDIYVVLADIHVVLSDIHVVFIDIHVVLTDIHEYCLWETFNATCGPGGVVLMESAHYGRMRRGRCADTDMYIGCQADVLPQLDGRCSGRPQCTVDVPEPSLHQLQPCPNDMMAYLEASFSCVQGLRCCSIY